MKTLLNFCVIALLGIALATFSFADAAITLEQAIAQGKVQATVLPFGDKGYSEGLRVDVKNISGKTIRLSMPKGTIFVPDNGEEQTLVTSEDEVFALSSGQTKQIIQMGFCTELHDHGSKSESTFTLSVSNNANLLNVLGLIDSLRISDHDCIQHAVWAITDNNSLGYVQLDDTLKARLVRERLSALTRQPMPWYETQSEIVITPEREFVIQAKEVTGQIVINSDVPIVLQGRVEDSNGKVLYTNPNPSRSDEGETTFDYLLHVEGWAKGTYYVIYTCNGKEIINQPFEL